MALNWFNKKDDEKADNKQEPTAIRSVDRSERLSDPAKANGWELVVPQRTGHVMSGLDKRRVVIIGRTGGIYVGYDVMPNEIKKNKVGVNRSTMQMILIPAGANDFDAYTLSGEADPLASHKATSTRRPTASSRAIWARGIWKLIDLDPALYSGVYTPRMQSDGSALIDLRLTTDR